MKKEIKVKWYEILSISVSCMCFIYFLIYIFTKNGIFPVSVYIYDNLVIPLTVLIIMGISFTCMGKGFAKDEALAVKRQTIRLLNNKRQQLVDYVNLAQELTNKNSQYYIDAFITKIKEDKGLTDSEYWRKTDNVDTD